MKKLLLGASIGNCVHVAGVMHFLQLAEQEGYQTEFMGPAVPVNSLFQKIEELHPTVIGISYRLTPENIIPLLDEVTKRRAELDYCPDWVFGGTKPVADIAKRYGYFSFVSDGYDDINDSIRYLRGWSSGEKGMEAYPQTLVERIQMSYPYPILRHHFGRPSMEETFKGIEKIADAKILDVISIGPDQNAQQYYFHPEKMQEDYSGAGGVPLRSKEDFVSLKRASRRGNYPLLRCYSGTEDVFEYAELLVDTIQNAWTAIPLCWYNELDGRGTRKLEVSIEEAQRLIKWHAEKKIPVEINEPHHWGLRDAHDVIPVVMAYISAYNAKKLGVQHYVAQYMFNNPNGLSFSMDYAKVLAMIEMVESLEDEHFHTYRETRTGLALLNADENVAKGQLAASTFMQMMVKPHIIHVVGYCEADHAATAEEVIESCRIVKGVIRHTLNDDLSLVKDQKIKRRKEELLKESQVLIDFIRNEYSNSYDPLTDPIVLSDCIKKGYIDAVHIKKNEKYRGILQTKIVDGKCVAYDKTSNKVLNEKDRLEKIKKLYEE